VLLRVKTGDQASFKISGKSMKGKPMQSRRIRKDIPRQIAPYDIACVTVSTGSWYFCTYLQLTLADEMFGSVREDREDKFSTISQRNTG
jgi:hypothetical protein